MTAPVFSAQRTAEGFATSGPETFSAGYTLQGDGIFASWRWSDGSLTIARDRSGVQPLFWSVTPTSVHVSPSVDALLAAGIPAELDDTAMAVFLRLGFFVGDDTPFAAIRAVPNAPLVRWRPEGITCGDRRPYPPAAALSRKAIIERFADCFAAAVDRRLRAARAPIAVPLSGGHDSRHILLAIHETGTPPDRCVTVRPYPPAAADDVAIAEGVAAAAAVRHVLLPQRRNRLAAEREKNVLTHYCADEHAQFLPLRDYFRTEGCDVFDGLGGDVLSQSQRLDPVLHAEIAEGRFDWAAERILGLPETIEPAIAHLLTPAAAARFTRRAAASRVAGELARHADAPNPIAAFFFDSRMRREIALAPYGLLDVGTVWTPFLDPELVDLLLSLPFSSVADRRLHTETLQWRYPAFAALPFDRKRRGDGGASSIRRHAAALLALALRSSSSVIDLRAVAARAARAAITGTASQLWFLPRVLHTLQVEERYTEFTRGSQAA